MPHDAALVAETRAWFSKAGTDLRAGMFELGAVPPLTSDIVFHTQQAAEKAMKGFLTWHGRVYRKTHNLVEIGEACAAIDPTLEPLLRRAAELTEYAWRFRYPGNPEEPSEEEARGALTLAREVFDSLLHRLPQDVRP